MGDHGDEEDNKIISSLTKKNKNMEISIAEASTMFPGFRFSPTDEELICFYLKKKIDGSDNSVEVIPEVDICRYEPRDLPAISVIQSDDEWFFFSPRGRKYPNGSQSKRATESGYWKATGKERNVKSGSTIIGTKRTLVFHTGRAPKGQRTEWIMHEYCMSEKSDDLMVVCRLRKNSDFHLDNTQRKKSQERRNPSTVNNNANSSSGIEQNGVSDGAVVADCRSKECSSSYNSPSVEQIESGFEYDDKVPDELSPHASSSHQKECSIQEEDYFADIMKDDIIKLDDSAIFASPQHLQMVAPDPESKRKSKQPAEVTLSSPLNFQGIANRRLRLRRQKLELYEAQPMNTYRVKKVAYSTELTGHADLRQPSTCSVRLFSNTGIKCLLIFISLVILVSLFLYVQVGLSFFI
ncbi:hypothetical protein ACH5RR_021184 [Cinchona calisaya]|uniref:NAC domain-containing protein n=1 Tax=Cinchona calisaya TaxID=153742 RepID=A0ABD2ZK25_9GENT